MSEHAFSIEAAFRFGWRTTRANFKPLLGLSAATAFLSLMIQALTRDPTTDGLSGLLALILQGVQLFLVMVWIRAALDVHDGRRVLPERLLPGLFPFFNFLLTAALYGIIVTVGLALLIVPGVIWAVQFGFATLLVVDHELDPIEALRQSSRMTRGRKRHLLLFGLALIGLNLLGAIALGVGLLLTLPITYLAVAYAYRRVSAEVPLPIEAEVKKPAEGDREQPA